MSTNKRIGWCTPTAWLVMACLSQGAGAHGGDARQGGDATVVATTNRFHFRSDFRMNLHDHLYFVARRDTSRGVSTLERCSGTVPAVARERWLRSVQVYVDSLAQLGAFDRPMIDIRFVLSGLPGHGMTMPDWADRAMQDAEQVYRTCVWDAQDERNRVWATSTAELVKRFEARIASRLEELYRVDWEETPIRVDLVAYVSRQGANTVTNPDHILVSTFDEDYKGHGGLEMVFHEASHTLIGPRRGPISEALVAAAAELGTTPHRDLWHVVLFYTTGMTVRNILKEEFGIDYEPYIYSTGLFDRAWPELRDAVERYWTPYVEEQQGYKEAAGALLRALTQE
ncbi:MAG: hypothetical protein ACE10G_03700 [Gemmatimonadales bacterium]